MKRKDDDLLRLAFGELSAERARAVEARVAGDASASAEIEGLRDLRTGLENLPPPPPDNLSAERLRAAILDRDLRSRRPAPFARAWAPFAVAAVAAFALVSRPHPKAEPQIFAVNDHPVATDSLRAPAFHPFRAVDLGNAPSIVADPAPVEDAAVARTTPPPVERRAKTKARRRRPASESTSEEPLFALNPLDADRAPFTVAKNDAPQTMAAPTSAVVGNENGLAQETARSGSSDTVVLVSSKRDLDTGANAATETEATNVLVGG